MNEGEYGLLFDEKYLKYKNMLFRIAIPFMKSHHECEDILQEVFIKLLYFSPKFEDDEHEKRWLIRITVNLCKNKLKLFWNRNKVSLEELEAIEVEDNSKQVLLEIMGLPDKYKTVIYLYYFEGYKCTEISEILKVSESAVKMRLKRAKELLRILMDD